jgi:hypothetical protein
MRYSFILTLSSIVAIALSFPAYVDVDVEARQTRQVKPWTAPGPNDGESPTERRGGYL